MFRLLRYTLFLVILSACKGHYSISDTKPTHYEIKTLKNDSMALLSAFPYKSKLDTEMKTVIAYSDSALTRDGFETSLGNFVMAAMEDYVDTNRKDIGKNPIVIINRGGLRNNLPVGEITKGNIFEVMPFDNELVILKLSGKKLLECLQTVLKEKKIICYNIHFDTELNEPKNIILYEGDFNINNNYYVVTSDYLAMGGDGCTFFSKPISYETTGIKVRDAILRYCENLTKLKHHIQPYRLGRIRISK